MMLLVPRSCRTMIMPVTVPVIVAIARPVLHPVLQVLDMWLNYRRCYQQHCICHESHAISVWVMVAVLLRRVALVLISIWVGWIEWLRRVGWVMHWVGRIYWVVRWICRVGWVVSCIRWVWWVWRVVAIWTCSWWWAPWCGWVRSISHRWWWPVKWWWPCMIHWYLPVVEGEVVEGEVVACMFGGLHLSYVGHFLSVGRFLQYIELLLSAACSHH